MAKKHDAKWSSAASFGGNRDLVSLAKATTWLKRHLGRADVVCPCCEQLIKLDMRRLSRHLAAGLLVLYEYQAANRLRWVHLERAMHQIDVRGLPLAIRGELAALRHWGLLEVGRGARSGCYRVTVAGENAILYDLGVKSCQLRFQGRFVSLCGPDTTLKTIVGAAMWRQLRRHNYKEREPQGYK